MSLKDFARSIVSYASASGLRYYSNIIEILPETNTRITFQEFKKFNEIVHHIDDIGFAIHIFSESGSTHGLSKSDLKRAVKGKNKINKIKLKRKEKIKL